MNSNYNVLGPNLEPNRRIIQSFYQQLRPDLLFRFRARDGLALQTAAVSLNIIPRTEALGATEEIDRWDNLQSKRMEFVTLIAHIAPRLINTPESVDSDQADLELMLGCLQQLDSPDRNARLAACEQLGQLGRGSARPGLARTAEADPDSEVRSAAKEAITDLEARRFPQSIVANRPLLLSFQYPNIPPLKAFTNHLGVAVFEHVPENAECALRLGETAESELERLIADIPEQLKSHSEAQIEGCHWEVRASSVSARRTQLAITSLTEEAHGKCVELLTGIFRRQSLPLEPNTDYRTRLFELPTIECRPFFPIDSVISPTSKEVSFAVDSFAADSIQAKLGNLGAFYVQPQDQRLEPVQIVSSGEEILLYVASLSNELKRAVVTVKCLGLQDSAVLCFDNALQSYVAKVGMRIPISAAANARFEFIVQRHT